MDDGLTDELLADVPEPDLPLSFPLLQLSLRHQRRDDKDAHWTGSAVLKMNHSLNPCTTNAVGPSRRQRDGSESGGGGSISMGIREAIGPGRGAGGKRSDEEGQCWSDDEVYVAGVPRQRQGGDDRYRMRPMGMHRDGQNSNRKAVSRETEMAIALVGRRTAAPRDSLLHRQCPLKFLSDILSSAHKQHGPRRLVKLLYRRSCRRSGRVLAPSQPCTGARTPAEAVVWGCWYRAGAADRCGSGEIEVRVQGGACIYREKSKCRVRALLTRLVDPRRPGRRSRERASKAGQAETRWGLSCRLIAHSRIPRHVVVLCFPARIRSSTPARSGGV